jgi:beta-hydroxyacyl-ACP dehydratase FabZ
MADAGTENTAHQTHNSDASAKDGAPEVSPKNPRVQMPKVPYPPLSMPLGYEEICQILPHRYPFLLVDRIIELEPGHRCVGVKNVTANEEHFQGHFPGHPVMPGVLILEAMAQVAGVLTLVSRNTPGALSYFAAIEKARFRQPVRPGDQLITEATLSVLRGDLCKVHVVGRVDEQIVVESDYTFMTRSDNASAAVVQNQTSALLTQGLTPMNAAAPANAAPAAQNGTASATQNGPHSAAPVAPATPAVAKNGASSTHQSSASTESAPALPRTEGVMPPRESTGRTFVHPTALVDPKAELEEGVWVGPLLHHRRRHAHR